MMDVSSGPVDTPDVMDVIIYDVDTTPSPHSVPKDLSLIPDDTVNVLDLLLGDDDPASSPAIVASGGLCHGEPTSSQLCDDPLLASGLISTPNALLILSSTLKDATTCDSLCFDHDSKRVCTSSCQDPCRPCSSRSFYLPKLKLTTSKFIDKTASGDPIVSFRGISSSSSDDSSSLSSGTPDRSATSDKNQRRLPKSLELLDCAFQRQLDVFAALVFERNSNNIRICSYFRCLPISLPGSAHICCNYRDCSFEASSTELF